MVFKLGSLKIFCVEKKHSCVLHIRPTELEDRSPLRKYINLPSETTLKNPFHELSLPLSGDWATLFQVHRIFSLILLILIQLFKDFKFLINKNQIFKHNG